METVVTWFIGNAIARKLVVSAILIGLIVGGRQVVLRLLFRRISDRGLQYQWRRSSNYIAAILLVLLLLPVWISGLAGYTATYLGLVSAGLAIALQGLIVNFFGWAFILWRRPLRVGDRIQIGEHTGDVIDIRIFQFLLMEVGNWVDAEQSTGRIIYIPNGRVFTEALANYNRGFQFIWNELPVLLTFESNWSAAKTILQELANDHCASTTIAAEQSLQQVSRSMLLMYTTLTPTVYTRVHESGILLTVRYLCAPRQRRGSAQAIWEAILQAFAEQPDIQFAYPTYRIYQPDRMHPGSKAPIDGVNPGSI